MHVPQVYSFVFIQMSVRSKHLEFERDELRNQVEELCRMRTTAEE